MEPTYCSSSSSSSVLRCLKLTASNATHYGRAEGVVRGQQNVTFIDMRTAGFVLTFRSNAVLLELRHYDIVTG